MVDFVSIHLGEWRDLSQDLDRDTRTTFRDICEMFWRLDGHMEDNDQRNARTFDMSVQAYRKHKRRLLDMGKIELRDGLIWCEYAEEKLNKIKEKSEKARNNINKRWHKNYAKSLETKKTEDTDVYTNSLTRKALSVPDRDTYVKTAVERWNALAEEIGLPKVQKITKARRAACAARLKDAGGLDGWDAALDKIRGSPFLRGDSERGWCANFDFLMRESKFVKLMEGGYERKDCANDPGAGPGTLGGNEVMGRTPNRAERQQAKTRDLIHDFASGSRTSW